MEIKLRALFDEETRKEIKAHVLGMARNVAREAIDETIREEIKRIGSDLKARYEKNDWFFQRVVKGILESEMKTRWGDIGQALIKAATESVDEVVAEKLKNKTVWEASKQEAYIRKVVRSELAGMLGKVKD